MSDPKRVLEMRQHNDAGTEPAQRRMDAHRAIARAIKRSGIEFDMTTDGGGVEFDPAKETIRVPKTLLSRNQGERAMQGAYYATKACLIRGSNADSHQVDLAATVGATLIAHRMAAKAGREWKGPEEPATLKEAGRLLQRQPQRLQEIVDKSRLVEARLTPGGPDWETPRHQRADRRPRPRAAEDRGKDRRPEGTQGSRAAGGRSRTGAAAAAGKPGDGKAVARSHPVRAGDVVAGTNRGAATADEAADRARARAGETGDTCAGSEPRRARASAVAAPGRSCAERTKKRREATRTKPSCKRSSERSGERPIRNGLCCSGRRRGGRCDRTAILT